MGSPWGLTLFQKEGFNQMGRHWGLAIFQEEGFNWMGRPWGLALTQDEPSRSKREHKYGTCVVLVGVEDKGIRGLIWKQVKKIWKSKCGCVAIYPLSRHKS
jgi:hypothetical protein